MRFKAILCVLFAISISPVRADRGGVVLHDADVVVYPVLVRGTEASAYVAVSGATGLRTSRPLEGAKVTVSLESAKPKKLRRLASTTTGTLGAVVTRFDVPKVAPGQYVLVVSTRSSHGDDTVRRPVEVVDKTHLHLRTDRGVYRPGQTIRWRVTALSSADAHATAGKIEVAILDPRGTAIWRGAEPVGKTGMVAGELPLGDDLILGSYSLQATMGPARATEPFQIKQFDLAPFAVSIVPDAEVPLARGTRLRGHVVARYSYGEPVSGDASIKILGDGSALYDKVAKLDRHGRFRFSVSAGDHDRLSVTATVTDGAGRSHSGSLGIPVRADALAIAIIPERPKLAPNRTQWVTVITTDGAGNLAPADIFFKASGRARRVRKKSKGAVRFAVKPRDGRLQLTAGAVDAEGRVARTTWSQYSGVGESERLIRADNAVVGAGERVAITGRWAKPAGPVMVSLLRHGNPVAGTIAKVDKRGRLVAKLAPPDGAFGLATVRAVDIGWDQRTGRVRAESQQLSVYLSPARLDVGIRAGKRYRPGQTAMIDVVVVNAAGEPAVGAGISASVIDERVLALSEPRPDLVEALGSVDAVNGRASGLAFADLMRKQRDQTAIDAMRAIIEALPPDPSAPAIRIAAAERFSAELFRVNRADQAIYDHLLVDPGELGTGTGKEWEFRASPAKLLAEAGWKPADRNTPWREPTSWAYARQLDPGWTFDRTAQRIANERLDRLATRLNAIRKTARSALRRQRTAGLSRLVARRRVAKYLAVDPWGTAIEVRTLENEPAGAGKEVTIVELVSAGPDQKLDTSDDLAIWDVFNDGGDGYGGLLGSGYGGGSGTGWGSIGSGRYGTIGHGGGAGPEAAVRRRFDETVLWVAGVETDASGRARLSVPLADSVTGWQVAVEALGTRGGVGAAKARLETFLPLYVDARVPSALTVGDRYVLAAVAANHTAGQKILSVALEASGGLKRVGRKTAKVTLPAGTTRAISFPIRAADVGTGRVKLTLSDGKGEPLDAVERSIGIEPPGAMVREIRTASARDGAIQLDIEVPKTAMAGTTAGRIRLFRSASDQAMDGLEGMLAEPHGCFEQASSTTYPNLLVLRLLKGRPDMSSARARAKTLVGKGYQRLISYEVEGGGFSWFGESPANQVLTAYGLMEFVDMAAVYPVDPAVIERTRKWLLEKQGGDGAWKPDKSWLHDWSSVQGKVSTTAYVAWALAESGYRGKRLLRAFSFLRKNRGKLANDPYLLALWAAAETASGSKAKTPLAMLDRHAERKSDHVFYSANGQTLFYASGQGADLQVTALAITALARTGAKADADRALSWVWSARSPNYGWGTTQSSVLALRAAALMSPDKPPVAGIVKVTMDGKSIGTIDLSSTGVPSLELPAGGAPGAHSIAITGKHVDALSADVRWSWRDGSDPKPLDAGIGIELAVPADKPHLGESIQLGVTLENTGDEMIAMPTAIVPIAPGFSADVQSLRALQKSGAISKYSDLGSEVHLYLTSLPPGSAKTLTVLVMANAEVDVAQRPARAYAYYDPAVRGASGASRLRSAPRRPKRH